MKKKFIAPKEFVLYDSMEDFSYEDYLEWCEENEIEPSPEDSRQFYAWEAEERSIMLDDFLANLSWTKIDCPLMIVGALGLWDGCHSVVPVPVESEDYGKVHLSDGYKGYRNPSLLKAIKRIVSGNDVWDWDIHYENGVIKVVTHHHDGTNIFYIRKLSKKGVKGMRAAMSRYEDCNPKEWWFAKIKYKELDF